VKLITDILREYRNGKLADYASRLLAECVHAVDDTGKPGEVTITLKITPEKGGGSFKGIKASVKMKRPEPDIPEAVFYSDADGNLHRSDPNQNEMFKDVSGQGRAAGSA
jgi:6-phosphogluconate dehydrogenase